MESGYHHGALRQALLEAALAMLEEGQELSLRSVARRAGVSHAAPYRHFADRRALIAAVAQEGLGSLREALLAAGARTEADPGARLLEIGVAYVRFALESPPRFRLMFSAELANREGLPELQAAYDAAYEVLLREVRRVHGAAADAEEVRFRALRAWSVVHGLANLLLENQVRGVRTPDDAEWIARRVLRRNVPVAG